MMGSSIDTLFATLGDGLLGDDDGPPPLEPAGAPLPLLTQFGEQSMEDKKPPAKPVESDEAMSKRLAAEWKYDDVMDSKAKSPPVASVPTTLPVASVAKSPPVASPPAPPQRVPSPMDVETTLSDEELARKLQAEWDAEITASTSSVTAVPGSPLPRVETPPDLPALIDGTNLSPANHVVSHPGQPVANIDGVVTAAPTLTKQANVATKDKLDFEKYGDTFNLFHYNGLRGGTLTPFRVTRLSAEEAVGASIALNRGAGNASSHNLGGSGDLEDVVRTKWPSCMVNWLDKDPPFID